jgi:putative transposase
MHTAYKYRLYPTAEQQNQLKQICGSVRWLWNHMLDMNQKQYAADKKFVFAYDMAMCLPELKKQNNWLKNAPSQSLQQKCMDLDAALKRVWKQKFGFPKFKSKHTAQDSFRIPQTNNQIKINAKNIVVPKLGAIKWVYHRPISGIVKSITVSRDVDQWYVSVLCEQDNPTTQPINDTKCVGIDLGISSFVVTSDGQKITKPSHTSNHARRLKRAQRQLACKQRASANRAKAKTRVAKIHRTIRRQRQDFLHKLSNQLVKQYDLIYTEDLKTKSLVENKRQRSLNRAIQDQGWGMFLTMLAYKAARAGKHMVRIDTYAPSSKTCHFCQHKIAKLALDVRSWVCPACNTQLDRDLNAAQNIEFWGRMMVDAKWFTNTPGTGEINACGDTSVQDSQAYDWHFEVSEKQEAACSLEQR